jgi:hypothetical protein
VNGISKGFRNVDVAEVGADGVAGTDADIAECQRGLSYTHAMSSRWLGDNARIDGTGGSQSPVLGFVQCGWTLPKTARKTSGITSDENIRLAIVISQVLNLDDVHDVLPPVYFLRLASLFRSFLSSNARYHSVR